MGGCCSLCSTHEHMIPDCYVWQRGPPFVGETVPFVVTEVIDGDTLRGYYLIHTTIPFFIDVRLYGIDTPEKRKEPQQQVAAIAVTKRVKQLLGPLPTRVLLHIHSWDKYGGRIVGTPYISSDKFSLCEYMVEQRWAHVYYGRGPKPPWTLPELQLLELL
jgi:endonuclease YncB( thermonuclease family)